ncbi:carotenoid oxygenase [Caulobacter vibrioides]|uniref:carotenoid oxygenase family protein n=1 Tax=Caulobacter vibrioides TaxID=155892 RepID=UPI000BB4CEC6|nr:carotenoid oxygenase family protein [Caulobacter vibrioides]ATC23334.1 carotenoid oxygenase [Caulobacter vibrioides]AZH11547.1 carotenoid oxygenase [Caulobacter vibrioides]PLR12993.1 carotenoid oxygenase [Caulobacter vibrioides]
MNRRDILRGAALTGTAAVLTPETLWAAAANDWTLGIADVEADIAPTGLTRIHGRAPADLTGTLFRNGPAKFRRPGGAVGHWFDGDGMVRKFQMADGQARMAARFVDTVKRRQDTAADAVITPGYGTASGPGARLGSADDANAANTSVMMAGGELWALWEGGSPTAMDPVTLETRGFKALSPDMKGMPFLAHPRVEPDGTVWNLGLAGKRAVVWNLSADGALRKAEVITLPRAGYMHDFTATERSLVIILQPWVQEGMSMPIATNMVWKPELGTKVLVLDKNDLSKRRVFELPPFFFFHLGDAWEEADGTIRFDACIDKDPSGTAANGGAIVRGEFLKAPPPRRAMITLRANGQAELAAEAVSAEFPRSDPRFAGFARRYSVHLTNERPDRPLFQSVAVRDWKKDRDQVFDFGARHLVEEMVFAPRPGSSAELDGWLVGTTLNLDARATELHVFDAGHVERGPLVTWRASVALPVTFHGVFVGA